MREELSVAVGPAIPHLRRKGAEEGEIPGELAAAFKLSQVAAGIASEITHREALGW